MKRLLAAGTLVAALMAGCAGAPAPAGRHSGRGLATDGERKEIGQGIFLEQFSDRIEVRTATSDPLATVAAPFPNAQTWTRFYDHYLVLVITPNTVGPGGRIHRVDLHTGDTADLGAIVGPPWRDGMATSRDGRYLAFQAGSMGFPVQLIDFATGDRKDVPGEAQLSGASWSPAGALLAVRAAEPGASLPVYIGSQWRDGATHIDLITPSGSVRHLHPPEPLQLTYGPVWSPDGSQVAATSGIVQGIGQGPDGGAVYTPQVLWAVDVAANRWTRLGDVAPDHRLTQWPSPAAKQVDEAPAATALLSSLTLPRTSTHPRPQRKESL